MSLYTGNNSGLMSSLFGSYKNSLFGGLSSSLSDYSMMQKRLVQRRRQTKQTKLIKTIRQHR